MSKVRVVKALTKAMIRKMDRKSAKEAAEKTLRGIRQRESVRGMERPARTAKERRLARARWNSSAWQSAETRSLIKRRGARARASEVEAQQEALRRLFRRLNPPPAKRPRHNIPTKPGR